jgi:hypothetical protein
MGQSAAQAAAFFEEIAAGHQVWTVDGENGYIAPLNGERRAMPFGSKHSRAERIIATIAVYKDFDTVAITLDAWRHRWLTGLGRDGILVGVNWSGPSATGYDLEPAQALARLKDQAAVPTNDDR